MRKPSPAMVVALLGLFLGLGGVGLAANGQSLILGSANNTATAQTALTGTTSSAAFAVTNNGGGSPLRLQGPTTKPPLLVNSATKVGNLNADRLDGQDSSAFVQAAEVRRVGPLQLPGTANTGFKTLTTVGPLVFKMACTNSAGFKIAGLYIRTTVPHAAYSDVAPSSMGPTQHSDPDMSANTDYALGGTGAPGFTSVSGVALAPDGRHVSFDLYVGQDISGTSASDCLGGGTFVVQ